MDDKNPTGKIVTTPISKGSHQRYRDHRGHLGSSSGGKRKEIPQSPKKLPFIYSETSSSDSDCRKSSDSDCRKSSDSNPESQDRNKRYTKRKNTPKNKKSYSEQSSSSTSPGASTTKNNQNDNAKNGAKSTEKSVETGGPVASTSTEPVHESVRVSAAEIIRTAPQNVFAPKNVDKDPNQPQGNVAVELELDKSQRKIMDFFSKSNRGASTFLSSEPTTTTATTSPLRVKNIEKEKIPPQSADERPMPLDLSTGPQKNHSDESFQSPETESSPEPPVEKESELRLPAATQSIQDKTNRAELDGAAAKTDEVLTTPRIISNDISSSFSSTSTEQQSQSKSLDDTNANDTSQNESGVSPLPSSLTQRRDSEAQSHDESNSNDTNHQIDESGSSTSTDSLTRHRELVSPTAHSPSSSPATSPIRPGQPALPTIQEESNEDIDAEAENQARKQNKRPLPARKGPQKNKRKRTRRTDGVVREINRLQRTTNLLIPRAPFQRLIREEIAAATLPHESHLIQSTALEALREASEAYLVEFFEEVNMFASHRTRVTIDQRDAQLAIRIRKLHDRM